MAVLDRALIDRELVRRGLSARRLAALSGLTEATLSRARGGRPVSAQSLRQITEALASVPPLSLSLVAPDEMAS